MLMLSRIKLCYIAPCATEKRLRNVENYKDNSAWLIIVIMVLFILPHLEFFTEAD